MHVNHNLKTETKSKKKNWFEINDKFGISSIAQKFSSMRNKIKEVKKSCSERLPALNCLNKSFDENENNTIFKNY